MCDRNQGSEQQAVRSGVFLAIARPQPSPEKSTGTGAGIVVLAVPGVSLASSVRAVLPSVPTLAIFVPLRAYTRDFAIQNTT